jgi:hypothetical protein
VPFFYWVVKSEHNRCWHGVYAWVLKSLFHFAAFSTSATKTIQTNLPNNFPHHWNDSEEPGMKSVNSVTIVFNCVHQVLDCPIENNSDSLQVQRRDDESFKKTSIQKFRFTLVRSPLRSQQLPNHSDQENDCSHGVKTWWACSQKLGCRLYDTMSLRFASTCLGITWSLLYNIIRG